MQELDSKVSGQSQSRLLEDLLHLSLCVGPESVSAAPWGQPLSLWARSQAGCPEGAGDEVAVDRVPGCCPGIIGPISLFALSVLARYFS